MKILIAGKNGQVGRCLVDLLEEETDLTFLALDRNELDITDPVQVNKIVSEFQPNIIINAAAYTAVDKAEQENELAYSINRDGPHNLATAANDICAVIIHISTDYVFAGDSLECYDESEQTNPQSEYGRSKLAGEKAIVEVCSRHIILRTAWVFGIHGDNFVKTMLRLGKDKGNLVVVDDQFGGPTYAGDISKAILKISKHLFAGNTDYGVYHFSGYPYVSWYVFAQSIFENANERGVIKQKIILNPIKTCNYPTLAKRPVNSRLNCEKILQTFGIEQSDWLSALKKIEEYS